MIYPSTHNCQQSHSHPTLVSFVHNICMCIYVIPYVQGQPMYQQPAEAREKADNIVCMLDSNVCFGGDGTFIDTFSHVRNLGRRTILPLCAYHNSHFTLGQYSNPRARSLIYPCLPALQAVASLYGWSWRRRAVAM